MEQEVMVALVNPGRNPEFAACEPLNLEYIASYLERNNIGVKIIDELSGQNVEKELERLNPTIVGLTATTPIAPDAYRIADYCKKKGMLTVMGGVHATIMPEEALQHCDVVVVGEGETAMVDIVKNNIKSGIVTRPYIENIDETPMPARHLVNMDYYFSVATNFWYFAPDVKTGTILTSRGCPFSCIFCHNSWRKAPFRFNSAERVIEEMKMLVEKYKIQALFFIDDNLFANRPRLEKILALMKENNFNLVWGCNSRVNNITPELLKKAKEVGCRAISFGFESGSQRILNVLNKGAKVEQGVEAVKMCKEAGITVMGSFMIGNPTETLEDIWATQDFIRNNNIDFAGICFATPFPGTKLWTWCEEHKLIPANPDWSKFIVSKCSTPIVACDTIPREKLEELFYETDAMVSKKKKGIKVSWLIRTVLTHPIRTLMIVKRSDSLMKYVKQLKVG